MPDNFYEIEAQSDERIDRFLVAQLNQLSRSYIQRLMKESQVTVDGKVVKQNYKLTRGEMIKIMIPDLKDPDILPENIPLDILYEDSDLLIVNKPKGMVVHPSAGHYAGTLVNALMFYCKQDLSGINGVMRPGIVHRIDKNTTGSIIVCKNDVAHQSIAAQLKEHSIKREYHALVHGLIKEDTGTIQGPIGRHPVDRKKMSINHQNGKTATTHYEVIKRFEKFSYVKCILETGRTHQIRVHMASIHHPLLGDDVYGPVKCPIKGLNGQCLHAKKLIISHPRTGESIKVDAALPDYFVELLGVL